MPHFSTSSFIAGLIVGLALSGAWFLRSGLSLPSLSPTTSTPSSTSTEGSNDIITVADQPAGDMVVVQSVNAPASGVWMAVREINGNDLGNILGAARVSGSTSMVSIILLRATQPGRSYAVELYRDDGSGTFNVASSSVYIDFDTSAPVIAHFSTTD